ncbi:5-(carboxyamino)imidazole ribonucleotide synthase [Alteribacillus sp. HJP-4]|uniref:5-(carboxyamino)imidazole ribonucleotide synthase n=1 Tax=Alteribacillus sp. HJP-4 TaxID=2775394 RepID=UPI0035CCEBD2
MSRFIPPGKTIGILGGGQLGRMMAIAARPMGYRIAVLEPKKDSPTGQTADKEVVAAYDDRSGAEELAEICDVLTYEFENIDGETASFLEETLYLPQGSGLLTTTQHRLKEKTALEKAGVQVAPYVPVRTSEDLEQALSRLGRPAVLKTCRGGYDGKGQVVIKEDTSAEEAFAEVSKGLEADLVLEAWIPFVKEISVVVTRSTTGETTAFPTGENKHVNSILHQTIVPARISVELTEKAEAIAFQLAEKLNLVGTLAVEMFVVNEDTLYVNELAPRPHNSGHYTIEACETSQFEQHIRAVCGWPLGSCELTKPAVMTNILGQHIPYVMDHLTDFAKGHLHLYGKDEAKTGRKMGHWTVTGKSVEEALEKTEEVWPEYLTIDK